ncbi:MAG: isoprenylcysteine carboxylmethyltransferase family protein [Gemmatimonadaceae bacterium]|nr:isoprenylcysteine carboxylmethyltransferase family protein [Gemmatimonadaceae bacterium]
MKSPGVRFPPPLIYVGALVIGWILDRRVRALPLIGEPGLLWDFGLLLVALGLGLTAWGMLTFRAARTAIIPMRGASRLVDHGPYRFTRNPMYTGFTLMYLGAAAIMYSAWPLLALPIVVALLVRLVIEREERYLQDAFGSDYSDYRARVRRWL